MRVALLVAAAVLTAALAMIGALTAPARPTPAPPVPVAVSRTATAVPTPRPPALLRRTLDRQDRVTRAHARRESEALDGRPLLAELPLELGPVTLTPVGLAADGTGTIVELTGPDRQAAERAYRQALQALGDSGTAYEPRWTP